MRYILNDTGYLSAVSFGGDVICGEDGCTEYTGSVPVGYISLVDWYADECEKLYRWKVVDGELVKDTTVPVHEYHGHVAHVPELTYQQRAALHNLALAYYNARATTFRYDWDAEHTWYANNRCWNGTHFNLCCATFIEMVWMGRSVNDFKGKTGSTYSNAITKAFDWGYCFQFKDRTNIGGYAKRNSAGAITGYYKYNRPLDTDEYSYSVNTSYNADYVDDSARPNAQGFNCFMFAHDMAKELWHLGCEIPFSELAVGDLLFIGQKWDEPVEDYLFTQNKYFRGITHVAMVYQKDGEKLTLIDCTDEVGANYTIVTSVETHSSEISTRARAISMLQNVVMCARHPAAWGKSNMAGRTKIDFIPFGYTDGLTRGRAIPFGETMSGQTVKEGLWYVDVNTNKMGTALFNGQVTKWSDTAFDTKYSNA